ncbi:hypothetical protein [Flavobacterium terrigena]|nr:hypothetical protein [Flavobacterium terrigena]
MIVGGGDKGNIDLIDLVDLELGDDSGGGSVSTGGGSGDVDPKGGGGIPPVDMPAL